MPVYKINENTNVVSTLVKAFNLTNVQTEDARNNPYTPDKVQNGYVAPDDVRPAKMQGMGGIPVFVDVTLAGPTGSVDKPDTYIDNITGKEIEIPIIKFEAVICTVDFPMNIVKTPIQGRNGTVKEYIGMDDAKITFNGVICGTNGVYPKEDVQALFNWAQAPVAKAVICPFLQNLGITSLVVEDISIPQTVGGYSFQTFSINCVSDLPVELKIQ